MNAVIVFAQGLPDWYPKICRPRMVEYAQRIGAAFCEISPEGDFCGVVSRGSYIGQKVAGFDRSLVLDADVIVSRECPDVFLLSPGRVWMAADAPPGDTEGDYRMDQVVSLQAIRGSCNWGSGYGNAGVVLLDRNHCGVWCSWVPLHRGMWPDQGNLNWTIRKRGYKLDILPRSLNSFGLNNGFDVGELIDIEKVCEGAFIAHAAGIGNRQLALEQMDRLLP